MSIFTKIAIPRPNSARPTTASTAGRKSSFGQFGSTVNQGPDLIQNVTSTFSTIQQELNNDSLLRILNFDNQLLENKAIVLSENGDLNGIQNLLSNGLDMSKCKGLNGFTPLHHASNRGHAQIVAELLKHNVAIDIQNDFGETPLHLAVYAGNILIVDQLIDKGANINARNNDNETPLFYASRKSMPAIVRLLLQRGADVNAQDKYGDIAIDHATNINTKKAFDSKAIDSNSSNLNFGYDHLHLIFSYLTLNDILNNVALKTKGNNTFKNIKF
jgi:ankyrin repeat protein